MLKWAALILSAVGGWVAGLFRSDNKAKLSSIATAIASWNWAWQNQNMQMYMFAWTPISLVYLQINDFHNIFKCRAAWICTGDHNHWLHKCQKISNSILISWQGKNINIICVFDCEEGGPSFTAAIPGVYVPLGLCLAEAPDLMGAMSPCPRKGSVCQDQITLPNFPFTWDFYPPTRYI